MQHALFLPVMDKAVLRDIGLLEGEIEAYLCLLRVGAASVTTLHKETGLHRTHIYDLLEKLKEKGLVSEYIQSGIKFFQATTPKKLLSYLEEKKAAVETVLPDLEAMSKLKKEETIVELYKGKEGLKSVLLDILNMSRDYVVMGSIIQFETILQFAFPQFLKKIEKQNIKERILCDKKEGVTRIKTGTYRYLEPGQLFPSSFWVYGDKVAIFVWNPPYYVTLIKNKDIAKTYLTYFEYFWKRAKPF